MSKLLFNILVISCVSLFFYVSSAVAASGPMDSLTPTLDGIMEIITDEQLSGDEHKDVRRNKIMALATKGFDFESMSRLSLGKTWKKIDGSQRKYFEKLFTKLLENAYIGKLESYTGQVTEFQGEKIKGKKAEVSTIVKNNGVALPVNYIMVQKPDGWKVYDIKIEGVRLLRNYREQFKSIIRKDKFEGLLKVLEDKNASFTSGA